MLYPYPIFDNIVQELLLGEGRGINVRPPNQGSRAVNHITSSVFISDMKHFEKLVAFGIIFLANSIRHVLGRSA